MKITTTIRDLAKHMDVSVSTVSRAMNNHNDINEKTKNKILKAAKQLDYRPNSIAKSLIQNKTYTVGLMVSDISDPFFSNIAVGIENVLSQRGYQVVYTNTSRDRLKENKFIESIFNRKMDGVILTPNYIDSEIISMLKKVNVPVVLLRRRSPSGLDIPFIDVDHYKGACKAIEYLISKGHKNICFMGMTETSFVSNERLRGYMDTMQKNSLFTNENYLEIAGRTIESGKKAMEKLIKKNQDLTALFASNDLLGIGALEWLAEQNISVPDQISVIGFDNLELADLYWIKLTTMAQPRERMGRLAAELLLEMINGSKEHKSILLESKLIKRKTC